MIFEEFLEACDNVQILREPPNEWPMLLRSLAFDKGGNWDIAHGIAQNVPSKQGSAVHAYLHRKEGAEWNAEYWYRRARRSPFRGSLDEEWVSLAKELTR